MTQYLVCNDERVPDHTDEELAQEYTAVRVPVAQTKAAGVSVFTGGRPQEVPCFQVPSPHPQTGWDQPRRRAAFVASGHPPSIVRLPPWGASSRPTIMEA